VDLQGWFDFDWLYDWAAEHAGRSHPVPTFVEVGVWKGLSISYLCKALLQVYGDNPFNLYAVDTWAMGDPGNANRNLRKPLDELKAAGTTLYEVYRHNLVSQGLSRFVTDLRFPSTLAAAYVDFADFVFIDGDHSAEAVAVDVEAWRPKAGILAGHDGDEPGVQEGLDYALGRGNWFYLPYLRCWTTHWPLYQAWLPEKELHRITFERTVARVKAWAENTAPFSM